MLRRVDPVRLEFVLTRQASRKRPISYRWGSPADAWAADHVAWERQDAHRLARLSCHQVERRPAVGLAWGHQASRWAYARPADDQERAHPGAGPVARAAGLTTCRTHGCQGPW